MRSYDNTPILVADMRSNMQGRYDVGRAWLGTPGPYAASREGNRLLSFPVDFTDPCPAGYRPTDRRLSLHQLDPLKGL